MTFIWKSYKNPIIALAPMANITTMPFRSICHDMGANVVYTPMISSNAIIYNPEKTLKIAQFLSNEQPVIVQLFGYDGKIISKAAKIVDYNLKPAGIDINMGCPAPKVTGNECGSALLKNLEQACSLTNDIRREFNGQLSVKLRLGWSEPNIFSFVSELEKIGIDSISVHGRTASQGYRGKADWESINRIADSISIPVIGNGDINNWHLAYDRLSSSKLAGIMIGRGSLGNPWIFKEILNKEPFSMDKAELLRVVCLHLEKYIEFVGEERAIKEMRKHFGWYFKGFSGAHELRKRLIVANTLKEVETLLRGFKSLETEQILR